MASADPRPQLPTQQLSGMVSRQRLDKFNGARNFVRCSRSLQWANRSSSELPTTARARRTTNALGVSLTAIGVGNADHRRFFDGRMRFERQFHFRGHTLNPEATMTSLARSMM